MTRMILAILVMAAATLLTRAFPFILFSRKNPPDWLIKGARLIPGAVMTVLVLYSLPIQADWTLSASWYPWLAAAAVTVLHLALKNPLVSIFGGTGFYMLLINV